MGLEKYEQVLFEGIVQEEQLACLEVNGIKRYITGLNEYAPEIKKLSEVDAKAKIKEIRFIVSELERDLGANDVDPKDTEFWSKVKMIRPDNHGFWDTIMMRMTNDPVFLNPKTDPYDLIRLKAIEAGGFSLIAKSLDEAGTRATPPKFYLDKYDESATIRTESKKIRNKALAELQKLFDKSSIKLMYVCKVIDANSPQYRKSTPLDVMYDNMDRYINGETEDKNKTRCAQLFLDTVSFDMETLKLRALVKDSTFYKLIGTRSDGFIYHMNTGSMMGRNTADLMEYLKNPLHDTLLADLTTGLEKYWNS
jgi:hypothetical protein